MCALVFSVSPRPRSVSSSGGQESTGNSLHADAVLGENDLMPSEAQFNNVHLRPLQLLLMSARDRRCFFYIFSLPGPWTSIFALCEEVDASVFTPGALGKVPVGFEYVPWAGAMSQRCARQLIDACSWQDIDYPALSPIRAGKALCVRLENFAGTGPVRSMAASTQWPCGRSTSIWISTKWLRQRLCRA